MIDKLRNSPKGQRRKQSKEINLSRIDASRKRKTVSIKTDPFGIVMVRGKLCLIKPWRNSQTTKEANKEAQGKIICRERTHYTNAKKNHRRTPLASRMYVTSDFWSWAGGMGWGPKETNYCSGLPQTIFKLHLKIIVSLVWLLLVRNPLLVRVNVQAYTSGIEKQ